MANPRGRSDLSRFSRVLAAHLENTREGHVEDLYTNEDEHNPSAIEDATEDFGMAHSIADPVRRAEKSTIHDEVTEDQAGRMLQHYRKRRDQGYDQEYSQEDLRDAYNSRFDY